MLGRAGQSSGGSCQSVRTTDSMNHRRAQLNVQLSTDDFSMFQSAFPGECGCFESWLGFVHRGEERDLVDGRWVWFGPFG